MEEEEEQRCKAKKEHVSQGTESVHCDWIMEVEWEERD